MEEKILKALTTVEQNLTNKFEHKCDEILNEINVKYKDLENKNKELAQKLEVQGNKMEKLEKQLKRKNIVMFGIEETENNYNELEEIIVQTIKEKLQVSLTMQDIEFVRRIGRKNNNNRPVNIGLTTMRKKTDILASRRNLRGTNLRIDQDLTESELTQRRNLKKYAIMLKEMGYDVYLRNNKIFLEKKPYTLSEIEELENNNFKDIVKVSQNSHVQEEYTSCDEVAGNVNNEEESQESEDEAENNTNADHLKEGRRRINSNKNKYITPKVKKDLRAKNKTIKGPIDTYTRQLRYKPSTSTSAI